MSIVHPLGYATAVMIYFVRVEFENCCNCMLFYSKDDADITSPQVNKKNHKSSAERHSLEFS